MSRILGFFRDMVMGYYLGASIYSDAYFAAFRFPNMFRRIFGEGAFNSAFVPLFGRSLEEEGHDEAQRFASNAFSWLVVILGVGTLVAIPLMRWIMGVFVFGFLVPEGDGDFKVTWDWVWEMARYPHGTEKFELTVAYGRIMFSYLMCMALAAHLSGVLNTLKVFGMPAFAPVLLNIILIAGLTVGIPLMGLQDDLATAGTLVAWCVFVAGFVQLGVLYVTCLRKGMRIRLMKPRFSPRMNRLAVLMVPGILAAGIQQFNLFVGTQIASIQDKAVSYLYYADRVYQLPLGMIGIAFGVVLLPEITRNLRSGDADLAKTKLTRGIEMSMLFTLPATAAMIAIPGPIISVLFQRGDQFTAATTVATAAALAAFAIGLPGYVLIKVLQPGYFAREDTKSPMYIAAVGVAVNIAMSLALFRSFGHVGIAFATAVSAWVMVLLLARGLVREAFLSLKTVRMGRLLRMILASAVMGVVVWWLAQVMSGWLEGSEVMRIVALGALVGIGVLLYGVLVVVTRAIVVTEVREALRRGK
ncbi:MAG: murein biosynthesis integral membrane protein MurJ [Verrucomicrobiota bacterium]